MVVTWLASAASLWISARLVPGVELAGFRTAMVAAVVLGLANALVRPLLIVLTLPVTILTLGLFLLVVNGLVIGLAASLVDGFRVHGLLPAMVMAIVVSIVSWGIGLVLGEEPNDRRRRRDER